MPVTDDIEIVDRIGMRWRVVPNADLRPLLDRVHYLGWRPGMLSIAAFNDNDEIVAGLVWNKPTTNMLPLDGTWFELTRWCLTPEAGPNAGSRSHRVSVQVIKRAFPKVTTLVSYSDPGQGHRGELYRACNWKWAPTMMRLDPPKKGANAWDNRRERKLGIKHDHPFIYPKDRWIFILQKDPNRDKYLMVSNTPRSLERWATRATDIEIRLAKESPSPNLSQFAKERWKD